MAVDLEKDRIRVNAICPASIDTDMPKSRIAHLTDAEKEEYERHHFVRQVMNRYGTPQEVADVIEFLLSDKASFLTGLSMPVDGGYMAW
jgi:NAD(P)-dependent dehydrogenase (short-subunit alcohol dehydrogenase family)